MPNLKPVWGRLLFAPLLALTLSGCVTTQGGGSTDGFPQFRLTGLTDIFSSEVREFRKLMTEGKTEQALAFFKEKEGYFSERYAKEEGQVPPEFTQLAEHVLNQEWQPSLLTGRTALISPVALTDPTARVQARTAWKDASERLAAVEGTALYWITRVGRDEVTKLIQAREKFKERATAQKDEVLPTMLEEVLATSLAGIPYVADLELYGADFRESPGFQKVAMERLNAASSPAQVETLARRLGDFLAPDNRATADRRFADAVRQAFMADGRISLDELSQLAQMKPPLGAAPDALKGVVKVGYADVSRSTLQGRVAPEFPVAFKDDYGLTLTPAFEALRSGQSLDNFDFILVVDVANAVAQRSVASSRSVASRYVSGKRREPNPDNAQALADLRREQAAFDANLQEMRNYVCRLPPQQCNRVISAMTVKGLAINAAVSSARTRYMNTPEYLDKTDYASYTYQSSEIKAIKSAELPYHLIDVKSRRVYSGVEKLSDSASFRQVANLHAQDENRSLALSGVSSDAEIQRWLRGGMEVGLSKLFAPANVQRASATPFEQTGQLAQLLGGARAQVNAASLKDDPVAIGGAFRLPQQ